MSWCTRFVSIILISAHLSALSSCTWWPGPKLVSSERLNGASTLKAFLPAHQALEHWGAEVIDRRGKRLALATCLPHGMILTKASETLDQNDLYLRRFHDRTRHPLRFRASDELNDLALFHSENYEGASVKWAARLPSEGEWVVSLSEPGEPRVGIVSGKRRSIPVPRGVLGVLLEHDSTGSRRNGSVIAEVFDDSPAEEAGLQAGDHLTAVNQVPIIDNRHLRSQIRRYLPETTVLLEYIRDERTRRQFLVLGDESLTEGEDRNLRMSGRVSQRRHGFEDIFQHDTPLMPTSMGGPVVNLEGELVGMNIARRDRVTTYTLTPQVIRRRISQEE